MRARDGRALGRSSPQALPRALRPRPTGEPPNQCSDHGQRVLPSPLFHPPSDFDFFIALYAVVCGHDYALLPFDAAGWYPASRMHRDHAAAACAAAAAIRSRLFPDRCCHCLRPFPDFDRMGELVERIRRMGRRSLEDQLELVDGCSPLAVPGRSRRTKGTIAITLEVVHVLWVKGGCRGF